MQVDAAVPLAVRVALVQDTVKPVTEPATLTVPAKFWTLARLTLSVVDAPVLKLMSDEAATAVKSPT